MIPEGTIVFSKRPSMTSMNLWKRVKENVPEIICPCHISLGTRMLVMESFVNGALFCRIGDTDQATVYMDYDVDVL